MVPQNELSQQHLQLWRSWIQTAPIPNPLNDPDYLKLIRHPDKRSLVAVGSDDQGPFLFLPFQQVRQHKLEPVALEISDCSQLITRPDCRFDPLQMMKSLGQSIYSFDHLFANESFSPEVFSFYEDPCFLIDLTSGFDAYRQHLKSAGSSVVSQTARKRRKLAREKGEVRFAWEVDDPDAFSKLIQWKSTQLEQQGFHHSFSEEWVQEFMKQHLQSQSNFSRGLLSGLYAGEELVVLHFGTIGYGTLNSWIPIVNPEFSKYSPAAMLYFDLAEHAALQGVEQLILGRGENQTKRRLSNREVSNFVGAFQTGPVNRVRFFALKCLYRFFRSRWGKGIHDSLRKIRRKISRN